MSKKVKKLHLAVIHNDVYMVTSLLGAGVDPNKKSKLGKHEEPMLWTAYELNNLAMVKLLITHQDRPANPNVQGKNGWLIMDVVEKNNIDLVKLLLHEAVIRIDREVEGPMLRTAYEQNNPAMIKLLITHPERPVNPNVQGKNAWLIMDAVAKNNIDLVKLLLHEVVIRIDREVEGPMLWTAYEQNNLAMIKLLITHPERPVNPNVHGKNGWLIMDAVVKNNVDLVKVLLNEAVLEIDLGVEGSIKF